MGGWGRTGVGPASLHGSGTLGHVGKETSVVKRLESSQPQETKVWGGRSYRLGRWAPRGRWVQQQGRAPSRVECLALTYKRHLRVKWLVLL